MPTCRRLSTQPTEEGTQQRSAVVRPQPLLDDASVIQSNIGAERRQRDTCAELRITRAEHDATNTRVQRRTGAHEARFERAVQRRIGNAPFPHRRHRSTDRLQLCVRERGSTFLAPIATFADHTSVEDDDGADRDFASRCGFAREFQTSRHRAFVVAGRDGRHDYARALSTADEKTLAKRDLLSAADLSPLELENLLDLAARMKGKRQEQILSGKTLGLLFFDRSLRTRVSFEVAMVQLGGHVINISAEREMYDLEPTEQVVMDGHAEEHVKDAARTLSRYVDVLGLRQIGRNPSWDVERGEPLLRSYARHASIPVVNLESSYEHPCQAFADALTMRENLVRLKGRKLTLAWCNDPEPRSMGASHSILHVAAALGMQVTVAHPLGFELDPVVMERVQQRAGESGGGLRVTNDLMEGAAGADVLYARSWGSIKYRGDVERETMVKRSLQSWRIDTDVMAKTAGAIFMHPLPVRRNVVATDEVLDGARSVIYDQAGNRVPVQKALLIQLLK